MRPCPALGNIERDLIIDADRLSFAALLIVRPIGSAVVVLGLEEEIQFTVDLPCYEPEGPRELLLNLSPVVEDVLVVAQEGLLGIRHQKAYDVVTDAGEASASASARWTAAMRLKRSWSGSSLDMS